MRQGKRITSQIIGIVILVICLVVFRDVITFPQITISQQTNKGVQVAQTSDQKVVEKVTTVSDKSLATAAKPEVLAAGGGCNGDWIPGKCSLFANKHINGTLLGKGGATTVMKDIIEEKEAYGISLSSGKGTSETKVDNTDPNDPKTWKIGLCNPAGGTKHGVASVSFSSIPLPKYMVQGLEKSQREIADNTYAQINKAFIDNLTPDQYKNFCEFAGNYYQQLRTAVTYKNTSSANSRGVNFFEAVLAKCATRSPGTELSASDFSKEWAAEEQGLATVTYQISIKNNLKDDEIPSADRTAMVDKGLGGLRNYNNGVADNYAFVWQPKNAPKAVKTAAVSVSTKLMYNKFSAIPQRSTELLKEDGAADKSGETTAVSTDKMIQTESSRQTILTAILGGMYYVPKEAIKSGNNFAMLYFDPIKADQNQRVCDPGASGSSNSCFVVDVTTHCSNVVTVLGITAGLTVDADIHVPYVNLSTVDTQRWAAVSQDNNVRSYSRTGDMQYGGSVRLPNYIDTATTEQLVAITGKATSRCKAALSPIISAQQAAGMGVNEVEYDALTEMLTKWKGYYSQAFVALPVNITAKVYMPYLHRILGKTVIGTGDIGNDEFIPAIYEYKIDDLMGGTEGLLPTDKNATDARALIDTAMAKQGINTMSDGMIDCEPASATTATMWPCQTSGYLMAKCQ